MGKIFVGNVPFKATEEELWAFFKTAGHPPSEVRIMTERETGRSRGFGFVTLIDDSTEQAIRELDRSDFQGRALIVNQAKPMEANSARPRNENRSRGRDFNNRGRRESRW